MNNLFSKSSKRLLEKSSNARLEDLIAIQRLLQIILKEQRHQRSDLKTVNDKLDRLLIDKHLQMQVDEYFKENPEDSKQEDI